MASTSARARAITIGSIVPATTRTRSCCRPPPTSLQVGAGFVAMAVAVDHAIMAALIGPEHRGRMAIPSLSRRVRSDSGVGHSVAERLSSCPLESLQETSKMSRSHTSRCGSAGRFASSPRRVVCCARAARSLSHPRHSSFWSLLLARHGRLVTRQELVARLWPDTFVDESNLTGAVWAVRKAFGHRERWIETVPKLGYRFIGPVVEGGLSADRESASTIPRIRFDRRAPARQPLGRSRTGLFRRRHDGCADHGPRADQRTESDLAHHHHAVQGNGQAAPGDRARAERRRRDRRHGTSHGRPRARDDAADSCCHRHACLGRPSRPSPVGRLVGAPRGGAGDRASHPGHAEARRTTCASPRHRPPDRMRTRPTSSAAIMRAK